jgi:hypothetical protein
MRTPGPPVAPSVVGGAVPAARSRSRLLRHQPSPAPVEATDGADGDGDLATSA